MPRKKATTKDDAPPKAPKRTRRTTSSRVAKAANTPAIERPRIMSSEEKRQLILAHAAVRQPVDTVQRFSLWTGVLVCVLAISIGWLYTIRQSIASAITPTESTQAEPLNYDELKASMHSNINEMVEQIDSLQEDHLLELREQAALIEVINESEQSTSTTATTSTQTEPIDQGRADLFKPSDNSNNSSSDNFALPPGVSIDSLNN
jgi:hypothetical protein